MNTSDFRVRVQAHVHVFAAAVPRVGVEHHEPGARHISGPSGRSRSVHLQAGCGGRGPRCRAGEQAREAGGAAMGDAVIVRLRTSHRAARGIACPS